MAASSLSCYNQLGKGGLTMLDQILAQKNLPSLFDSALDAPITREYLQKRRLEMLDILSTQVYGVTPARVPITVKKRTERKGEYAGKVLYRKVELTLHTPNGPFTFPLYLNIPFSTKPLPLILHINFRDQLPDKYYPVEEITDNGFATAMFCYKDITSDDADMTNGLAGLYYKTQERSATSWGKIGMWAWAASHCLDYLITLPEINPSQIVVAGHSRLGKTALWCAAQDERFLGCMSNDSGCAGSALSRGKSGESIEVITQVFPYWFCENYATYAGRENEQPFDQHFLLACIAPRPLLISTAQEDTWADPSHEMLSALAATPMYQAYCEDGLVMDADELPDAPVRYLDGNIGFAMRNGTHFLSRKDWQTTFQFFTPKFM